MVLLFILSLIGFNNHQTIALLHKKIKFMRKLEYKKEIDGLRSIAIISVILYHSQIGLWNDQYLKGGFIGVDIFFTISGYLISSLIFIEINNTKKFSFKNFYIKRIRRILPAFLVVTIASSFYAFKILLPLQYVEYIKSLLLSSIFLSNYFFYFNDITYGVETAFHIPLLHTWSLSVEEQFYIIFPLFSVFVYKFFKKYLLNILIVCFLLSFLSYLYFASINYSLTFYALQFRLWEIIAGSILAYLNIYKNKSYGIQWCQNLSIVGFFLIILPILFYKNNFFINVFPFLSVLGTCLVIFFSNKNNYVNKILTLKPLVFIGLISYSLYLWHYPIFVFRKLINPQNFNSIEKFIIIFILSVITYYIVEKPFRNLKKNYILKIIFIAFFLQLIFFIYQFKNSKIFLENIPKIVSKDLLFDSPWTKLKQNNLDCNMRNKNFCIFNEKGTKSIIFLGDSVLASITYDLVQELEKDNYKIIIMTNASCIYLPNYFNQYRNNRLRSEFTCDEDYQRTRHEEIIKHPNSLIVIGGGNLYLNEEVNFKTKSADINVEGYYIDSINVLLAKDYKILHFYPVPSFQLNASQELSKIFKKKNVNFKEFLSKNKYYIKESYKNYVHNNLKNFEIINIFNHPNFFSFYPDKIFCNNQLANYCVAHDDEDLFFYDQNHLASKGSQMLSREILNIIRTIYK